MTAAVTSLAFFGRLQWLDGRPSLDTIEDYRRANFTAALDTYRDDGAQFTTSVSADARRKTGSRRTSCWPRSIAS